MRRLIIAAGVVAIAAVALWIFVFSNSGGEGPPELGEPALDHIGLTSELFRERYNHVLSDRGAADEQLRRPTWSADLSVGLETAAQSIDEWGLLELYRDADQNLTAVVLTARPTIQEQEGRFSAVATAAIAATLDIDLSDAQEVLNELRPPPVEDEQDAPGEQSGERTVEREGTRLRMSVESGSWLLEITAAT